MAVNHQTKVLTSNIPSIVFTRLGQAVVNPRYLFIPVEVNTQRITDDLTVLCPLLEETFQAAHGPPHLLRYEAPTYTAAREASRACWDTRERGRRLKELFHVKTNTTRQTRGILSTILFIALGIVSLGATALTVRWTAQELHDMHDHLHQTNAALREELRTTIQLGNNMASYKHQLQETIWVVNNSASLQQIARAKFFVSTATRILDSYAEALQAAANGRLSVKLLMDLDQDTLFDRIHQEAHRHAREAAVLQPSNLLELETSYVETASGFTILLHVPLVNSQDILAMYRYTDMPLEAPRGKVLHLQAGTTKIIGLSQDSDKYVTFTDTDWDKCGVLGKLRLCDEVGVLHSKPHEDEHNQECLYHLLHHDLPKAMSTCPMAISKVEEAATKTGPSDFITFTRSPTIGLCSCDHSNITHLVDRQVHMHKTQHLSIPLGCTLRTSRLHLTASDPSFNRQDAQVTIPWPNSQILLMERFNISQAVNIYEDLLAFNISGPVDMSHIATVARELTQDDKKIQDVNPFSSIGKDLFQNFIPDIHIGGSILLILCLVALSLSLYNTCRIARLHSRDRERRVELQALKPPILR